jgi:hypothetical protein
MVFSPEEKRVEHNVLASVTVLIVNWNSGELLAECLEHLLEQTIQPENVIIKAKWDAIKGIPVMWRKRKEIQPNRQASALDIWRVLDKRLLPSPKSNKYS